MRPSPLSTPGKAALASATAPRIKLRILVGALALTVLWAGSATWFIVFHDEALARFVSQQSAMQYGYEERIGALRAQLDRSAIEQSAARDGVETRLAELAQRQTAMERRQAQMSALAASAAPAAEARLAEDSFAIEPAQPRPQLSQKPFPTPDSASVGSELRTRGAGGADGFGRQSAREVAHRIARIELRLDGLAEAQARALDEIGIRAGAQAQRLRGLVARVGLDLARFERSAPAGLGGPLMPIASDPFGIALAQAGRAVDEEARLRRIAAALPLRQPVLGAFSFSSGYGPRVDPFTRGLAMHTGVDMKAEYGEPARATAAGRVTVAEYSGGYGNMVEIDHGNGVATRYAHLSAYAVAPGQSVEAGGIVGRVGSTGRSTGSHLHYETRIDGEPVDPQRFLRAGNGFDVLALAAP